MRPKDQFAYAKRDRHRRANIWITSACVAGMYGIFAVGLTGAVRLRPANDDYWIIAESFEGLVEGLGFWWQSWSGWVLGNFLNVVVVGLPGSALPWGLASSVGFVAAALSVGAAAIFFLLNAVGWERRPLALALALAPVGATAWWAYLWSTQLIASTNSPLAIALTHWQNLNAAYVLPTVLATVGSVWIFALDRPRSARVRVPAAALFGLAIGFMNLVLSASILVMLFAASVITLRRSERSMGHEPRGRLHARLVASLGIVIAQMAALGAPGSQIRRTFIAPEAPQSLQETISIVGMLISRSLLDFLDLTINLGFAVAVAFGLTVSLFLYSFRHTLPELSTRRWLFIGASFSLVLNVVNNAVETLVGYGYWHRASLAVVVFWIGLLTGSYLGAAFLERTQYSHLKMVYFLGPLVVVVTLGSVAQMVDSALKRQSEWEVGSAPIPGVFDDIYGPQPWITRSWETIKESRDTPPRQAASSDAE